MNSRVPLNGRTGSSAVSTYLIFACLTLLLSTGGVMKVSANCSPLPSLLLSSYSFIFLAA